MGESFKHETEVMKTEREEEVAYRRVWRKELKVEHKISCYNLRNIVFTHLRAPLTGISVRLWMRNK